MAIHVARSADYYELFKNQTGGYLPLFQGTARYQTGHAFGDIFRGVIRSVLPVLLTGAKAFLSGLGMLNHKDRPYKIHLKKLFGLQIWLAFMLPMMRYTGTGRIRPEKTL